MFTGGEAVPVRAGGALRGRHRRRGAAVLRFQRDRRAEPHHDARRPRPPPADRRPAHRRHARAPARRRRRATSPTPDTPGHPVCKGPATCLGYLDDDARQRGAVHRRRLDAHRRPLHDRRRRLPAGRRAHVRHHHPRRQEHQRPAVEAEVAEHPAVAVAAAVAMPDEVFGERVCLYAELEPGADARPRRPGRLPPRRRACRRSGSPSGWSCSTRCPARRAARSPRVSCAPTSGAASKGNVPETMRGMPSPFLEPVDLVAGTVLHPETHRALLPRRVREELVGFEIDVVARAAPVRPAGRTARSRPRGPAR